MIDTDGKPVEANWSSYHFRTEDLTRVTNYRGTGGSGAIYFSKQWMDNGDTEARKPVTVRVYRKADVAAALKNYSEDAVVSLSDLSIGHADYTLSTDNNWFAEAALSDVENQINATGKTSASEGELGYLILEYKVGSDGAVAAKYPVSQLKAAANGRESTISGTVSNSKRQYEVSVQWQDGGKQAYITNTRIGQASLEVTKEWKDEKIRLCGIVGASGADFIKTSTGFSKGGATREDVELLRRYSPEHVKVKAAGGIASLADAEDFIALGAERLGTSRIVKLAMQLESESGAPDESY